MHDMRQLREISAGMARHCAMTNLFFRAALCFASLARAARAVRLAGQAVTLTPEVLCATSSRTDMLSHEQSKRIRELVGYLALRRCEAEAPNYHLVRFEILNLEATEIKEQPWIWSLVKLYFSFQRVV